MLRYIYSTSLWGVKIYNFLYEKLNNCSFIETNANKKIARQKLGRFRGNLNLLYIIFNSSAATSYYSKNLEIFEKLRSLSQVERAEFYGAQVASKSSISFLVKKGNNDNEEPQYEINLPALLISFSKSFSFLL